MKKLVPKHPRTDEFVAQSLYAVSSFKELEAKISALESKDERGAAFEVFAEAFLVTQESIDPNHYWPQGKIPLLVQEKLGLPRNDFGIDSVYLNQTQQYDACQCKFRTGRPTLGWEELATFVALASSDKFQNKVLFTNCEDVVPILRDRVVLIRGSRLDQLTPDNLQVINDWLSQRPPTPVKKQPRPDQAEALDKINAELQIADRAQSIQFCATGKSLVSLWLMESRSPDTTLVFVPSLALLSQIRNDWIIDRKKDFLHLCVCSDPRVEDNEGDISLADCDFPVSTSADEVRRFLDFPTTLPKVVFCTYQSTHVIVNAGRHVWDLGIFDEAHKTAGRQRRTFSSALDDGNVPIKKRVFFTATPRHCNPLRKDAEGEAEVLYSMDDEAQYGKVAYSLSCRKAVELGIICDYKVLITVFTTAEVNDWLLRHGRVPIKSVNEGGDFVTAWDVANRLAIAKAYNEYAVKKTFSFHSRVKMAKDFVSDGVQGIRSHLKDVTCRSVDGSMNIGERRKIMEVIKDGPRALLANAKCLTEGVNLPSVDCVAFLSPKRSRIDVAQSMGRGMRKNGCSKKTGYVIVPLYVALAESENFDEAIKRAKFDTVLEVLQTLKEIDESFMDFLKELAQPKKRAKGSSDWRLSDHVEFIAPTVLLEQLANTIQLECIDTLISPWDRRIADFVAYKKINGHCKVPFGDGSLGVWCVTVRGDHRKGKLSQNRISQLDELDFWWGLPDSADLWDKNYANLVTYKEVNGDCNVPKDNGSLGFWCDNQRQRKGTLTPEQITQLDALGFCWDP
jgi:predicted helicase